MEKGKIIRNGMGFFFFASYITLSCHSIWRHYKVSLIRITSQSQTRSEREERTIIKDDQKKKKDTGTLEDINLHL